MSNKEILEKAIQKAIDGGWKELEGVVRVVNYRFNRESAPVWFALGQGRSILADNLIFNPDFAKCIWRGRVFSKYPGMEIGIEREQQAWQYHLQQMVISDDPIKYLGENI